MDVRARLTEVLRETFQDDDLVIGDDTTADDIPGWDSVMHINVMYRIEEAFGVEFTDQQLGRFFRNVGELEEFLRANAGER